VVRPDAVREAVLPHEPLVHGGPERAVGHALVDDADDRAVAQLPEMFERQQRALLVVDIDARHAAPGDPVADTHDVGMVRREVV
jgi:hypothetical protein